MMRQSKGITLIALVATVIILLILLGIVIVGITNENGLLNYSKSAREKYSISKAKEKLEIKIMQFKTEITENQTLDEFNNYLLEDVKKGVYKVEKIYEDNDSTKEIENLNITDLEEGYTFEVDKDFNVNGPIESNSEIEATYEVISSEGTQNNILISIKCDTGIQKVTYPNGNVVDGNNKTIISIDYIVENEKQYEFIIKTQDKEEKFILDTNEMNNIVISETTSYAYPTLSVYGIEICKFVNIEYTENEEKYYSLDDGITWKQYTGNIKIINEGTIKAKNIINNKITQVITKDITLQLASDALEANSYDENEDTVGCAGTTQYLIVDEEMQGRKINVSAGTSASAYTYLYVYSINLLEEETKIIEVNANGGKNIDITIPDDCIKLKIKTQSRAFIKEVIICNEPIIEENKNYPIITINGITNIISEINISYFPSTVQKLYKIDEGEWKEYTETITVDVGSKVYAKGIDADGKETRIISECTTSLESDALDVECYNGNENDYGCSGTTQYLLVDNTMLNRKIIVSFEASAGAYGSACIYSIDSSGVKNNLTGTIDTRGGKTVEATIPSDSIKLEFYTQRGSSSWYAYIKEIIICNEPVIEENKNYPIITIDGITNIISEINISYFPTSVKKLYKIDEGEWKEYTETITVDVGSKVYAKGIDADGKETRIISECTTSLENDALDVECYNGNEDDYGCLGTTQYLIVDEGMQGREINVSAGTSASAYTYLYVYSINSLGEETKIIEVNANGGKNIDITIPDDCIKLKIKTQQNAFIKEVKVKTE